jgi:Alkaline and neutral invertase
MVNKTGYSKAIELLRQASTPMGFVASIQEHDNYKRIWTRDGVVNGLAALMSGDEDLIKTFRATIQTIFDYQHETGFIPSNVAMNGSVSYGGTVGRADNPSWAVIGLCQYSHVTGDDVYIEKYRRQVEKCFSVLDAWEFNGKHLIYVPQSGDWADEYIQHGYVLVDQLLRVWALRLAAAIYGRGVWKEKAERILDVIRSNFWNYQEHAPLYAPNLHHQLASAPTGHWFLGFNPSRIYKHFDLLANSVALLLAVGAEWQDRLVIDFLTKMIQPLHALIPSFYPSIENTDWEMGELRSNFAYTFRNKPHEFHNGGLWPVWNGFLVAALVKKNEKHLAHQIIERIHQANARNDWEINECYHGLSLENIGVPRCTWSAGGAIIAEQSLAGKSLLIGL